MRKTKKGKEFVELVPVAEEQVSPEEAMTIITNRRSEVKSVRYQPPLRIGSDGFGTFRVEWKNPRYRKVNL